MSLQRVIENLCVVVSSDGTLYGPFIESQDAADWASENEETVGDWYVKDISPLRYF